MSITCLPHDSASHEIVTWFETGVSIPQHAEIENGDPTLSFFDELLGTSEANSFWAAFESPPGFLSQNVIDLNFEACANSGEKPLLSLYETVQTIQKDLEYIKAKMTLRKA
ncbi:MAG: DUF5399 family protein [Simkaniaceae bacterium]|nr:DUF5399 family protein [Simkaniaceae bacterium]